jgi:DNA-binding transcriptional regulator YiaG
VAETTKQVLLKRAADLIGQQNLAARLKVPVALLQAWMAGHGTMPDRTLSLLVDFLSNPGKP